MDPYHLLNRPLASVRQRYGTRDTILYALGVGAASGSQAWDERHLRFAYEPHLQALPTMCAMLGDPGFWMREPDTGLDWHRLLHGEEAMQWHRPLPPAGEVLAHNRVLRVEDRGADRGALFVVERELHDAASGELVARTQTTVVARGNGGFSPTEGPLLAMGAPAPPPLPALPERAPDRRLRVPTDPRAPLLYRLSTDLNPLHADPAVARAAGFERPIMHGMCTFGLLGLLLVTEFCDFDATRLAGLRARFTAPLYPGETLECEFWRTGAQVQFRATAIERAAVVLNQGLATLHEGAALPGLSP
jgi:acyl dehydratase